MTPEQIADAILANRQAVPPASTHAPGIVAYRPEDIHTMIVDGIERALAEDRAGRSGRLIVDNPDARTTARRVARWHIGDGSWADLIIDAFIDPARAATALDEEMAE